MVGNPWVTNDFQGIQAFFGGIFTTLRWSRPTTIWHYISFKQVKLFYCIKSERQKIRGKQNFQDFSNKKKTFSKTTSNYHSNYHPIIIFGSFWGVLKYAKISLSTLSPSISVSQSLEECDSRMPLGTAATGTWDSQGLAVAVSAWRVPAWTYWDCNGLPIGSMYGIFANI